MRLSELIEMLEDTAQQLEQRQQDEPEFEIETDPEVQVGYQPSYPMSLDIDAVVDLTWQCSECEHDRTDEGHATECSVRGEVENRGLWLKGRDSYELPYAPRQVWA